MVRSGLLALALLAAALTACGDPADDEGTQPAPGVSSFEQGEFENLPRPPEAEPLGPRSEEEGIVTRSFEVEGMQPRDVLAFYEEQLEPLGWTPLGIEEFQQGYRGDWTNGEWNLRVSANSSPSLGEEDDAREQPLTQLSLVLSPESVTTVPAGGDG